MPNKNNRHEITSKDLPLHCPTDEIMQWDSHPRVFINVTADKLGKCPYCGNEYTLVEQKVTSTQE